MHSDFSTTEAAEPDADAADLLTEDEERDLHVNEDIVSRYHEHGYLTTGNALTTIQERRLYRGTHSSFEKYVQARLHLARATAYRLMAAVEVVEGLNLAASEMAVSKLETPREGTIRALTRIPADERQPVLAGLMDRMRNGSRLTASTVESVITSVLPKYSKQRAAKTLDPAQRKLADPRLEALAGEVLDLLVNKTTNYGIILKRAAVLARKVAR